MLTNYMEQNALKSDISLCKYALLNSSIHHVIFNVPSQAAVGEWLQCLRSIYVRAHYETVLTLTDARYSVMPPLSYATHLSQLWVAEQHSRVRSKNAILHRNAPLGEVAEEIVTGLPGNEYHRIRFFAPGERGAAVRWLIANDL